MTESAQSIKPGTVIGGKYRVERLIGTGGMGEVYAAAHLLIGSRVAIKVRRPGPCDPTATARAINEARALGTLQSEHVARVIDVGVLASYRPYIVMEHLDGHDLASELAARTRLPPSEAVDYILQALEGLAEAHGRGIVHRDIKPSNLFLARVRGRRTIVKVLDFGISKINSPRVSPVGNLTTGTVLLGTPAYMSPEQVRSPKDIDARTDIWSIGVVLYELICGERPYHGGTLVELFANMVERSPRAITEFEPACSPAIGRAVAGCLTVPTGGRFSDVATLAEALAPAIENGAARVDRIRAALTVSTSVRLVDAEAIAAREAPTATGADDGGALPAPTVSLAVQTNSAWGGLGAARSGTRRFAMSAAALALLALACFAIVAFRQYRTTRSAATAAAQSQSQSLTPPEWHSTERTPTPSPTVALVLPAVVSSDASVPPDTGSPAAVGSTFSPEVRAVAQKTLAPSRGGVKVQTSIAGPGRLFATPEAGTAPDLDLLNRH